MKKVIGADSVTTPSWLEDNYDSHERKAAIVHHNNGKLIEERELSLKKNKNIKVPCMERSLRLKIVSRRLAKKSTNKTKTNGQCNCDAKKKMNEKAKKKEMYQDRSELMSTRVMQAWENCEFQKDGEKPCKRSDKNFCEYAKTDAAYGKTGFTYKKTIKEDGKDVNKKIKLNSFQNQIFTKWRCVNVKQNDDDEFEHNPQETESDKDADLKNNTLFYCNIKDGDKYGKSKFHDVLSDIAWGGSKKSKSGKKPTVSCDCLKVKDVPYSIIKKF